MEGEDDVFEIEKILESFVKKVSGKGHLSRKLYSFRKM
jgi:hypothetical protein